MQCQKVRSAHPEPQRDARRTGVFRRVLPRYPFQVLAILLTLTFACGGDGMLPTTPSSPSVPTSANEPSGPNEQIQGTYSVTFAASSGCALSPEFLPPELRSRTYVATITQRPSTPSDVVDVVLSGADFRQNRFDGTVSGHTVTFRFGSGGIVEETSPGMFLGIDRGGRGSVSGSSITGTLSGSWCIGDDLEGYGHDCCAAGDFAFNRQ